MTAASTDNRNRQHGDQRHPPFAQEEQDHQRAEDGPQDAFLDQALDRVADVDRLVHDDLQVDVGPRSACSSCRRATALRSLTTSSVLEPELADRRECRPAAGR